LATWFDAGGGGWVYLGVWQTGERRGDMVSVGECKKGEMVVSGEFAKKVSIGSENLFSTQ
jgi:hypothetical protein